MSDFDEVRRRCSVFPFKKLSHDLVGVVTAQVEQPAFERCCSLCWEKSLDPRLCVEVDIGPPIGGTVDIYFKCLARLGLVHKPEGGES